MNFEKNTKAYIKKFFEQAHTIVPNLLPSELVENLRKTMCELFAVIEGEYFSTSEFISLRDIQVTQQRNAR